MFPIENFDGTILSFASTRVDYQTNKDLCQSVGQTKKR